MTKRQTVLAAAVPLLLANAACAQSSAEKPALEKPFVEKAPAIQLPAEPPVIVESRRVPSSMGTEYWLKFESGNPAVGQHAWAHVFEPEGITVLQANRPAGWQTVPHAHLHVLPRHAGDGVELTWPRKEPGIEALRALAARLAPALQGASA